jgi:tetratricopeptide (TPR) repeat protein
LRLTVTRGRLGIELYESLRLGPVEVSALSVSIPNLRFPVDLSGGVPTFRHRRGQLEHARLNVALPDLARWLGPRLQEVVGALERPVSLWTGPATVGVGLTGSRGALAFNLIWAPEGSAARWVVTRARGSGLAAPALGYALRAVDAMLPAAAERSGRVVTIPRAAHLLSCELLPRFGARVPALTDVRFGPLLVQEGELVVELDVSFPHFASLPEGLAAIELASLVVAADDALAMAAADDARSRYTQALERAPRHPELLGIIAEIDACAEHRVEAALGMLSEGGQVMQAGAVGATLLAQVGDVESAVQAFAAAARDESYSPLSALHWLSSGTLEGEPRNRAFALDQAVATCPDLARVRWARVEARLYRGDVPGAQADIQCLEAAAHGTVAKHRTMRRGAEALLRAGYVREARAAYEKSLRYLPADAEATAGLARALLELGRVDRSAALFERAIRLGEQQGTFDPSCVVELAKILASHARDLPAAIARVRQVSGDSETALQARALEARWRWALGDISGASIAFGRLREAIDVAPQVPRGASVWLAEAASFAHEVEGDLAAAERHLATALRVDPHDAKIQRAYRRAASALAARRRIEQQRSGHSADEPPSSSRPK